MTDKQTKFMDTFHIENVNISHTSFQTKKVTLEMPYNSLTTIMSIVESYEELVNDNIHEKFIRERNSEVKDMYEKYKILLKLYE